MKNKYFYSLVDADISKLEKEYIKLLTDKNLHEPNQRKAYIFLIWFLLNYGLQKEEITQYITDGSGDNSADIIFSSRNNNGRIEYYVIQSKWNIKNNCDTNLDSKTINGIITEFEEIAKCDIDINVIDNENFRVKYNHLIEHIRSSGKVNYIILSLNNIILETKDKKRIDSFNKNRQFNELLVYDINKLKIDYLDKYYKGYKIQNPLVTPKKPLEDIEIGILDLNDATAKHIRFPTPFESYIFCVKPEEIFNLFQKYEYSIFQDNIRNPLMASNINSKIADTLQNDPENFWYYNNGITGITKHIYDTNSSINGAKLKIKGLQIINGGQTFKTIAEYYARLSEVERSLLDSNVKIMFKVIKSSSDDFDRNITRFTNSQNSIEPRDFYSNDGIQKKIQEELIKNTNIWYETRRGEFIKRPPENIYRLENTLFAQAYLAFVLDFPEKSKSQVKKIFISKTDKGLYEDIFNESTKWIDLFLSYAVYCFILTKERGYRKKYNTIMRKMRQDSTYILTNEEKGFLNQEFILHATYHLTMLYKLYFLHNKKYGNLEEIVINEYWYKDNSTELNKIYEFLLEKVGKHIDQIKNEAGFSLTKYFKGSSATSELKNLSLER